MNKVGHVHLIGNSRSIADLRAEMDCVARSDAKVLITGESGVGKEVVARHIHETSPRRSAMFAPVNCAGIPETLLESELFGHVRGSFTGAYRDKPGKLEIARGGTIFLDEIGEMTLRMQGLFLRFLESGEIQKVGAERVTTLSDVRIIAATNRRLDDEITKGQFREDLFYRLNVIHLVVPPLRERREDVPLLIAHFLRRAMSGGGKGTVHANGHGRANGHGITVLDIAPEAVTVLSRYSWPGNVRQLENVIERMVVTGRREVVQVEDLPMEILESSSPGVNRPKRDRRRTTADDLFKKLVDERESFWTAVYPLYMNREITREHVRDVVHKGLEEARGNYKIVLQMFNMESREYKRFLDFLRKHDCQLPFKEYRTTASPRMARSV
jgi:transcriptional regulator with PAS, ATPase and Fis domain